MKKVFIFNKEWCNTKKFLISNVDEIYNVV